jgi:hypothetical protein
VPDYFSVSQYASQKFAWLRARNPNQVGRELRVARSGTLQQANDVSTILNEVLFGQRKETAPDEPNGFRRELIDQIVEWHAT